jgi:Escherichia/Staphylococcus phage prohead protease
MERRDTPPSQRIPRPRLVRAASGKPARIIGYAAKYYNAADPGTEYELFHWGDFTAVERLISGCFDRAIREDDVRALFNHDIDNVLGRNASGTLRLSSDSIGLRYEIDPPDATYARNLAACLERGDISGSSFSFDYREKSIIEQNLPDGKARDIIEVRDVKLYDVGPVTFPAYTSTTAGVERARARLASSAPLHKRFDLLAGLDPALSPERRRKVIAMRSRLRLLEL